LTIFFGATPRIRIYIHIPHLTMSAKDLCEIQELCERVAVVDIQSKKPARITPIAIRRYNAYVLRAYNQSSEATPKGRASLMDVLCVLKSIEQQVEYFESFDSEAELAALLEEQKSHAAAMSLHTGAPEKSAKQHTQQVKITRASLNGKFVLVDERGTYYEPVSPPHTVA